MNNGQNNSDIFRLLVEGVVDYAIYLLDPNGIVSNWNAGAERIKGYTAQEIIGEHFSKFYTEEDRRAGLPTVSLETARRTGRYDAEGWRVRKNGEKFLASVVIDAIYKDGSIIGFTKITRDITERQLSNLALQESEKNFRLLVDGVTDYALYMLDPSGLVTSWNAGGRRIKGYAPEEIIGRHFSVFYSDSDRAAGRPARALRIALEGGRYEEEGWRVRKDGTFFWASVVIDPIREESGRLVGFAKITRDISERKAAQDQLLKVQRQLADAQKMDALGQLTGGVAHDFNNLLMIISGHIHTIKKVANDAKSQRAAEAIETAAKRAATLTSQLLSFSRRQHVRPEPIDVGKRIQAIRDVLISGSGRNVSLEVNIAPDTWPVVVDVSEFETALVNLVVNARDAMPDGGSIFVSTRNEVDVGGNEHVEITLTDTGQGIPADVIAKVFDPFFTTKAVGKGTGLGLSQVYGFAHQAGGKVTIASELGQGTSVTISLPRADEIAQPLQDAPTVSRTGSGRVLVVEDNPDVASASLSLLEQLGYTVKWVSGAELALQTIAQGGFDLVFSDIVMPGQMNGLDLAKALKKDRPHLPILLTTGYSEAALDGGGEFPILRKPFAIHELSHALGQLTASRG